MRKYILLAVVMVLFGNAMQATPVSQETARQVAVNFWNTYRPADVKPVATMENYSFPELQHLFVFANDDQGFVIVTADDRVRPVVGYSFDSPFPSRLHPELRYWLSGYEEQISNAVAVEGAADPRWGALLDGEVPGAPLTLSNVPMLCQTRWDQGEPFNRLCPYDEYYNDRAVVGCVATAMAQIMKRWNHPSCGTGNHSYMHGSSDFDYSYGVLSADFEHTTYMWQLMPNLIPMTTMEERAMAVATISYHCGVAVDMMYGTHATGGSGAYSECGWWATACAEHAFYEYFKYENTLQHRNRDGYSDSVWLSFIDEDLANGRPIYYSGSDATGGHAFVLDGSNLDTTYHFNWGWSGYGDGFYAMNNLAPGGGGAGGNATYTFNYGQGAIFGIVPMEEQFDTVTVYDTICNDLESYVFYEYTLPVVSTTRELRHLDTIFNLHLTVVNTNEANFSSNTGGMGQVFTETYCYVDSLLLPECPYTRKKKYFFGWSRDNHGNAEIYQPGEKVGVRGNVTFYAIWKDSSTLAIRDVEEGVSLWPNPTSGELTVSLDEGRVVQLSVFDAVGRAVLREDYQNLLSKGVKISLQGLPSGVYTLQIKTEKGLYNQRIIKR